MRKLFATVAVMAVAGFAVAAELKSGPQAGDKLPGPFHPLNANGENAGKKACLYCKHGDSPVAMVFARTADCPQTQKLIKKLEEATAANAKAEMGAFVVFLSDDDKLAAKLKSMSDDHKLKNVTLAVDNPSGPAKYNVEKDADLTIVLYVDRTSKANYAFKKGAITDANIDAVMKDLSKILPEKK
ncbi:hypothetical protein BH11PLA2_BH11PLA2_44920 [soil metagenome]